MKTPMARLAGWATAGESTSESPGASSFDFTSSAGSMASSKAGGKTKKAIRQFIKEHPLTMAELYLTIGLCIYEVNSIFLEKNIDNIHNNTYCIPILISIYFLSFFRVHNALN